MTSRFDCYSIKIILVEWDSGSSDQNEDAYFQSEITLLPSIWGKMWVAKWGVNIYIYIYIYSIIGACIEYTSSIQFFLLEFSPIFNMVSEQFSNSG